VNASELSNFISPLVIAAVGFWIDRRNEDRAAVVQQKVETVHLTINSRMDQMLEVVKDKAHAEGFKEATDNAIKAKKDATAAATMAKGVVAEAVEAKDRANAE